MSTLSTRYIYDVERGYVTVRFITKTFIACTLTCKNKSVNLILIKVFYSGLLKPNMILTRLNRPNDDATYIERKSKRTG